MKGSFESFGELVSTRGGGGTLVVAAAHDAQTLEGAFAAAARFGLECHLVGDAEKIKRICDEKGAAPASVTHEPAAAAAAAAAVSMARDCPRGILVKGMLETGALLKAAVSREGGIRKSGTMSHVAFLEIPAYHKLLAVTDGGMCQSPGLAQKADILKNALSLWRGLAGEGFAPKVAVLSASERVDAKLEDSVHGAELAALARGGEFGDAIVAGPISFDLAASRESAMKKGYESPVCGDADILLVPGITAGNALCKSLVEWAGARMAGVVAGARVPIVLVSRSAGWEEKLNSIALCLGPAPIDNSGRV